MGEGRPRHCGRFGELFELPRATWIGVHQAERGSEALVGDRAEPSCRQRAGGFYMHAQDVDEQELSELRRRETGARKFSGRLADKLVEKPSQDRRMRGGGLDVNQRRQNVRE